MIADEPRADGRTCLLLLPGAGNPGEVGEGGFWHMAARSFRMAGWQVTAVEHGVTGGSLNPKRREWMPRARDELARLGPRDAAVVTASDEDDLYGLFHLLPAMQLEYAIGATLIVHIPSSKAFKRKLNEAPFADMLRIASPFRRTIFVAPRAECAGLTAQLGLVVHAIVDDMGSSDGAADQPVVPRWCDVPADIWTDGFGPIVLVVSALWGRTGSTTVFDAQIRYLVSRGYLVVNVFVDHLPRWSDDRQARIETLLGESFSKTRPHLHFVAERKLRTPAETEAWLRKFDVLSRVGRTGALLADAMVDDEAQLAWCGRKTSFVVLNHLYHFGFHNRFTSAPVVLETHDIMTDLFNCHETLPFVPLEPDSRQLRFSDEERMWRAVDATVNLSPGDVEIVAPHVARNFLARPYADPRPRAPRGWPQVIEDNRLEAVLSKHDRFDVMLWGTPHLNNLKSIEWFFEAVVPLDARLQRLRILILGRITECFSDALRHRPGLTLLGPVDYLEDFFARADILVIPDLQGTGSSIKLLDALASGCCFVVSASGARGLDMAAAGYTPSRTPADFAADLTSLLTSDAARERRRAVARAVYQANFSREAYEETWDRVLQSIDQRYRLR